MKLTEAQNQERIDLYRQGLSDKEIAQTIGVSYSTIFLWRKSRRLPNKNSQDKARRDQAKLINKLYMDGLSDREIAEKGGFTISKIKYWRRLDDIPANRGGVKYAERFQMFQDGLSLREIAKKQGIGLVALKQWARRNGLEV